MAACHILPAGLRVSCVVKTWRHMVHTRATLLSQAHPPTLLALAGMGVYTGSSESSASEEAGGQGAAATGNESSGGESSGGSSSAGSSSKGGLRARCAPAQPPPAAVALDEEEGGQQPQQRRRWARWHAKALACCRPAPPGGARAGCAPCGWLKLQFLKLRVIKVGVSRRGRWEGRGGPRWRCVECSAASAFNLGVSREDRVCQPSLDQHCGGKAEL